jgi:hypothetical protein
MDQAFYNSKNNPTNVRWSTSTCTPCDNVKGRYEYEYDQLGRPTSAVFYEENQLVEKIRYHY